MRIVSIIVALVVGGFLYLLVFERDRIESLAGLSGDEALVEAEEAVAEDIAASGDAASSAAEIAAPTVSVVAIRSEARMIDSAVLVRGRTEAARQVEVKAETTGTVVSAPLRKGAEVAAGDLLCEIDRGTRDAARAEAEARLEGARAQLADAEINEAAARRLSADGFAAETRLTAATAALKAASASVGSAEAALAAADKELQRLEIRAPFAGLLETDTAETGALMQPGAVCATVIQLDPIRLVGFVAETDVDRIALGAMAGACLATGREVRGEVVFLSRSADLETRTFRVEVEVNNSDRSIRDGQTAEIVIASDGATAHLVPQSALTLDDDGDLGLRTVEADGTAGFAAVEIIRDTRDGIWVSGLSERAEIVVVGQEFITSGVPLDVTYRESGT